MENLEALTPERMTRFLSGSAGIDFTGQTRTEKYAWLQSTLIEQEYFFVGQETARIGTRHDGQGCGIESAQVTRLIRGYREDGEIRVNAKARRRFPVNTRPTT